MKEANEETANLMLRTVDRENFGYLNPEDVDNIPCEDLHILNQIWLHYSNGKFGFSIQEKIYGRQIGTSEKNQEVFRKFGDFVGWRKDGKWLQYYKLTFNQESSPLGHLPECISFLYEFNHIWIEDKSESNTISTAIDVELERMLIYFMLRMKKCRL